MVAWGVKFTQIKNLLKHERSLLCQFRTGILPLRIETGIYVGEPVDTQTCRFCDLNCVVDKEHFLLTCDLHSTIRFKLRIKVVSCIKRVSKFIFVDSPLCSHPKLFTWLSEKIQQLTVHFDIPVFADIIIRITNNAITVWTVPHFVIKMYKSLSIVLLPFSIHSWVNCSKVCSQTKITCSFV